MAFWELIIVDDYQSCVDVFVFFPWLKIEEAALVLAYILVPIFALISLLEGPNRMENFRLGAT